MSKVYEVWYFTINGDNEGADRCGVYANRKSAEEHLHYIYNELSSEAKEQEYGWITDYEPGDHIYGYGFNGDSDEWEIHEQDISDEFDQNAAKLF